MNAVTVILLSLGTSIVTTIGMFYAAERWPPAAQTATTHAVPNLTGLTETDARTNLDALGLKLMVAGREPNAKQEPGSVLRQAPSAGQMLQRGQPVSVTFALAMPELPDVTGKTLEEAKRALETAGYEVAVGEPAPSATHPKDSVAAQNPEAGAPLEKGEVVTLTPSEGPAEAEVPKLIGLSLNNAQSVGKKEGFEVVVQWVSLAETGTYVVLRQTPAPGESAEPGSKVTVVVNR